MKNILLMAHDDAGQESRLQTALDVVRAVEGHLTCLDICVMPVLAGDYDGGATAILLEDERQREQGNRARLEQRLTNEGVAWDWIEVSGSIAPCMTQASALADLIVVNRALDDFPLPDMRQAASEIIVKSGRPILAVPNGISGLDLGGKAVIAWNGSASSGAAIRAAVPLLRLASDVTIFEIDDGTVCAPAEEAAAYLSRHDIHAEIRRIASDGADPAYLLLREIHREHASYVVMGGFGRRRIAEALFGGFTRTMLSKCLVPMFIAH